MIKAEELRLNNYVTIDNPNYHLKLKDVVLSVTGISPNTWRGKSTHAVSLEHIRQEENKYYETFSQSIKYIEPIELTEEWLIKFGFEYEYKTGPQEKQYSLKCDNGELLVHFDKMAEFGMLLLLDDVELKSVHQLQNLYFALTGFELNIKS